MLFCTVYFSPYTSYYVCTHASYIITIYTHVLHYTLPQYVYDILACIIQCVCQPPLSHVHIYIYIGKLTLLLGPPSSGKTLFLKALSGRNINKNLHNDGDIYYNEESTANTHKFLVPKIAEYIEQNDTHAATLTVEETFEYG